MAQQGGGGSELVGATTLAHRGRRYGLGPTVDGGYAIWDVTLRGAPVRSFPGTPEGWNDAWHAYQELEASYLPPSRWTRGQPIVPQPMRAGQVLDAGVNLYRLHFRTLMPLVAVVVIPVELLTLLISLQVPSSRAALVVQIGVIVLIALFSVALMTAAVLRTAADAYIGQPPRIGSALRFALTRVHSILWVSLLVGLLVLIPMIPTVVAALARAPDALVVILGIAGAAGVIAIAVTFMFAPPIVVVDDVRGSRALGRSRMLTRGFRWRIFGTLLLAYLLAAVVAFVIALPFTPLTQGEITGELTTGGWIAVSIRDSLTQIITTPFTTVVTVLLYFDARVRKEALDLEIMAQQLGEPAGEPGG
ncbi:MAG TPA: hypothetical protein VM638_07140 [Actinomycetota bacterium]|nr:hypothetical protein [Actinomycetota bacterium]